MQIVNREVAIAIIREMATNYVHSHARSPSTIIVVSGTTMAFRGLRDESEDIDKLKGLSISRPLGFWCSPIIPGHWSSAMAVQHPGVRGCRDGSVIKLVRRA